MGLRIWDLALDLGSKGVGVMGLRSFGVGVDDLEFGFVGVSSDPEHRAFSCPRPHKPPSDELPRFRQLWGVSQILEPDELRALLP